MNISGISLGYITVEGVRLTSDVDLLYGDLITVNERRGFCNNANKRQEDFRLSCKKHKPSAKSRKSCS